jgi:hypothetical protein
MAETLSAIWYEVGAVLLVIAAGLANLLRTSRSGDSGDK